VPKRDHHVRRTMGTTARCGANEGKITEKKKSAARRVRFHLLLGYTKKPAGGGRKKKANLQSTLLSGRKGGGKGKKEKGKKGIRFFNSHISSPWRRKRGTSVR